MRSTQYKTHRLRRLDMDLRNHGGIEGMYRKLAASGKYTRRGIADYLSFTPSQLDYWIRRWNKEKGDTNDQS